MKNRKSKIIILIITFITIISLWGSAVLALAPGEVKIRTEVGDKELIEFGNKALGIIQTVGIVGSVLILIIIGIKFMTGSVEEKASYKKAMMPYVVGAALLFSSTTIANVVYKASQPTATQFAIKVYKCKCGYPRYNNYTHICTRTGCKETSYTTVWTCPNEDWNAILILKDNGLKYCPRCNQYFK